MVYGTAKYYASFIKVGAKDNSALSSIVKLTQNFVDIQNKADEVKRKAIVYLENCDNDRGRKCIDDLKKREL